MTAPRFEFTAEPGQCPACLAHPGWAHPEETGKRSDPADICRACLGSGRRLVSYGQTWQPPSGSVTRGSWRCDHCQTNRSTREARHHRPGSSECLQDRLEREWSIGYDD